MSLTARILGCGSSGGVPRIGNHWGECDPANPLNRRTRCSLLLQRGLLLLLCEGGRRPLAEDSVPKAPRESGRCEVVQMGGKCGPSSCR